MANILESNIVNYVCACGHLNPITKLFFCRHCLKPRCGFCVCHEVRKFRHFSLIFIDFVNIFGIMPPVIWISTKFTQQINQVDSHFCYNCLENIPSGEAKLKKYRCNKCFECPTCQQTLSSRATSVQVARTDSDNKAESSPTPAAPEGEKEKVTPRSATRKMYYLSCFSCRWTSRDAGLPDQPNGNFGQM